MSESRVELYPITIIDDFYDDPDAIREFALEESYRYDHEGRWPGLRSQFLHLTHDGLYNHFCSQILKLWYLPNMELSWQCDTCFQKVWRFSSDPNSLKNRGWIHRDSEYLFGGLVYLDPNPAPNSGTILYQKKKNESWIGSAQQKSFLYNGVVSEFDEEKYNEEWNYNNDQFTESIRVENKYNRMILFSSKTWHAADNYWRPDDDDFRLFQPFFFGQVNCHARPPLYR